MKLSIKNIALALGIVAGAAATAVITTKSFNSLPDKTSSKDNATDEEKENNEVEEDILYV